MATDTKISVRDVSRTFVNKEGARVEALRSVSFDVEDAYSQDGRDIGEFLVLLGPSGCGKSTLLRMIAGLDEPTSGQVLVKGKQVHGPGRDRGMVFQKYTSFPWLTVADNIAYGPKINGVPEPEIRKTVDHLIQAVGLTGFEKAYPDTLSGGMQQRVAIARTLANRPQVILMDEPFGALDAQTRGDMQQLLLRVWDETASTILFVTHDVDEAIYLADRIYVLSARPGTIVGDIPVRFGRPRDPAVRHTAEFYDMQQHILASLRSAPGKGQVRVECLMAQDDPNGQEINYVKEAAVLQYNWITLLGLLCFAIVSGSALPLVLGAGLELMYLSLIPQNPRFRRLVRSWKFEEGKQENVKKLTAIYQEIPPEMRARYVKLNSVVEAIRKNYHGLSSFSQIYTNQMEDKLRSLLGAYIRLLHAAWQHREYLRTTDLGAVERELAQLRKTKESEVAKVQEINRKRIEILTKRVEKFKKIRENCDVVDAQCAAVEDVLGLIRDQSVSMRDPQQLSEHLEGLVRDVEQTEETVREVETIFENIPELGMTPAASDTESNGPAPSSRNRIRG